MGVAFVSSEIGVICCLALLLTSLTTMSLATVDKCADQCSCKWKGGKRTVECVNRSLTGIPDWIDPETQVFDVTGNDIRVLTSNIFVRVRLTNLQRLYMRSCRMQKIDNDALAGLTNLVELDLSNNRLTTIPSSSFLNTPFLRDLSLSYNPLNSVTSYAFRNTPNLVKLDLSNAQIRTIEASGFKGLELLETLKLHNNRISTLNPGTFDPLNKLTSIELHENPWICNCHLRELKMWLVEHNLPTLIAPMCHGPEQLAKRLFTDLMIDDFACRPVLMVPSRYAEATIGENASIVCRVSAVPPAKVKWYWNGKLLTNHSSFSSYQKIIIHEDGQFSKSSKLVLTNAQESDSSEFFCVAENRAGSVEANFTLHVSLRTAGMSTLGSGQIAGISAALVVLILFILLIILVLFVRLRRMPLKDVKNSATMDVNNAENSVCLDTNNQEQGADRRNHGKISDTETTSFGDVNGKPVSLDLSYVQRPQNNQQNHHPHHQQQQEVIVSSSITENEYSSTRYEQHNSHHHHHHQNHHNQHHQHHQNYHHNRDIVGDYTSQSSLMPAIDNPDLIRDTRGGSIDDNDPYDINDDADINLTIDGRLLYPGCLWDTVTSEPRTSAPLTGNPYVPAKDISQSSLTTTTNNDNFPPGAKQMRVWQKGVPVLPPVSALKRVLGSTRSSPDEGYQEGTGTDV